MLLVLKREWEACNADEGPKGTKTTIPPGRHEVERIPNPLGYPDAPWLVLVGTKIGATEGSWRQWKNGDGVNKNPDSPDYGKPIDWGDFEVIIEE